MKIIYRLTAFVFLFNPIFVFPASIDFIPTGYSLYKDKGFSFIYPSDLLVSANKGLYGDNCLLLYENSKLENFDVLISKERFSHSKLNEYGFQITNDGRWKINGAQDTIEGYASEFVTHKIVEGLASCRFEDDNGIHSAGLCYKAFIKSSSYVFFIESKGQPFAGDRIEQYRLMARSLISTDINALNLFIHRSSPLKAQQPFSSERAANH